MRTLVHITDLHFGKLTPGAPARLERRIRDLDPDMCIISGDLTMRARPREWRQARAFIDRLPGFPMVVPGNHDLPYVNLFERFFHPYRRFQSYISEYTDPVYTDDEMAIMGINTARSWVPHYTWKEGGISDRQARAAESFFNSAGGDRIKIVFAHHPFLPPPDRPRTYLVRNARAALEAFARAGVDLVLGGHLHLAYSGDIAAFHVGIERRMICIQGSTATSSRLRGREPNGYSEIMISENRVEAVFRQWTEGDYQVVDGASYKRVASGWEKEETRRP